MFSTRILSLTVGLVAAYGSCGTSACATGNNWSTNYGSHSVSPGTIDPFNTPGVVNVSNLSLFNVGSFSNTDYGKTLKLVYSFICEIAEDVRPKPGAINSPFSAVLNFSTLKPDVIEPAEARAAIYRLLRFSVSLMPPAYFTKYYAAFVTRKYTECFKLMEVLFAPGFKHEAEIIECLIYKNSLIKDTPRGYVFFNYETKTSYFVSRHYDEVLVENSFFYLPDYVLSFDTFITGSFHFDKVLVEQLVHYRLISRELFEMYSHKMKEFHASFNTLPANVKTIEILRLKFFVFQLISFGLADAGVINPRHRQEFELCLRDIFDKKSEKFFVSYAIGLGILNK